jgi:hypothetical protein
MSSPGKPEPLDLARGLPVTRKDVLALRRARAFSSLTWPEYVAFLAAQPLPSIEELRSRPLLTGEPFRLGD